MVEEVTLCMVSGCNKVAEARGLCPAHYVEHEEAKLADANETRTLTEDERQQLLDEARRLAAQAGQTLDGGARRISIDITGPTVAITVRSARFLMALLDMYILPGPQAKAGALMAQTELEDALRPYPLPPQTPEPQTRAERRRAAHT